MITINNLISGICSALHDGFSAGYEIYKESIEQGLKEPCFFVQCLKPTDTIFLNKRRYRTNQFMVQYFPASSTKYAESNEVIEKLNSILEYITIDGDLYYGKDVSATISGDGTLSYEISYDFFTIEVEDTIKMNDLTENTNVKGV